MAGELLGSRLSVLALVFLAMYVSVREVTCWSSVFCENRQFSLWCGEAEKLKIRSATFGRSNPYTCWNIHIYSVSCTRSVTTIMQRLCDGQIRCSGLANVYTFGDPCRYTYKYMTVEYDCEKMATTTTTTTLAPTPAPATSIVRVACDNTGLYLSCTSGMIFIQSAEYGRTSNTTCGNDAVAPVSENAVMPVSIACQGKTSCYIDVSNDTLQVNPNLPDDILKYLEVNYTCESGGTTKVICENAMDQLQCSVGKTIQILSATFGRQDTFTCPYGYMGNTNCRANIYIQMASWCNNKSVCVIPASGQFVRTDPCQYTYKYVTVQYKCV